MALNERKKRFGNEYIIDLNATQAAIRAGYSEKTARSIGQRLLTNVDIQQYISTIQKKLQEKTGITQERVLQEYARIAFVDIRNFFDVNNNLISVKDLSDEAAAALSQVEIEHVKTDIATTKRTTTTQTTSSKKIKIFDKKGALDSLAKHLGMFEKDNAQKKPEIDFANAKITFR